MLDYRQQQSVCVWGGGPSVSQLAGGLFNLLSSLRTGPSEWCFS